MGHKAKGDAGDDRRRDERHARTVAVRVAHDADGLRAQSLNISTRGLYCVVPRYVHPFSKLRVALDLPFASGEHATVECEAVVVRVEPDTPSPAAKEYRLAVYFLNLDRVDARRIEGFLAESH